MERKVTQIEQGKREQCSADWTRALKLSASHQRCNRNPKRLCDPGDIQHTDIALAALDLAHVRAVDARGIGQGFLGQAALMADRANRCAKAAQLTVSVSVDRLAGHIFLVARRALIGHGIYDPLSN